MLRLVEKVNVDDASVFPIVVVVPLYEIPVVFVSSVVNLVPSPDNCVCALEVSEFIKANVALGIVFKLPLKVMLDVARVFATVVVVPLNVFEPLKTLFAESETPVKLFI